MKIGEEKEHIYSLMRDVTTERRKLTEIYFSLKKRLDDLNEIEQRGLTELSIKGYLDLHNNLKKEESKTSIMNIERESKSNNLSETDKNNAIKKIERSTEEEKEVHKPRFNKEIEQQKDMKSKTMMGSQLSIEHMLSIVEGILKENGAPMHLSELHKEVNKVLDVEVTVKNFRNNIMYRLSKREDTKIDRPFRGYYQYKF